MGEGGLSASEVGKEIAEHREHSEHGEATGRDRIITIIEAILLAVVAVLAAWSGFASSKWGTESSLTLARASAARSHGQPGQSERRGPAELRLLDLQRLVHRLHRRQPVGHGLAERRFRPEFKVAFDAWLATNPATNPKRPPGPTYMPEYKQPDLAKADTLDAKADELYTEGAKDGSTADDYVRTTVFLATVLFLVGISGHFRVRAARYGLVAVGAIILAVAVAILIGAPKPPA